MTPDVWHIAELAVMALVSALVNMRVIRVEIRGLKQSVRECKADSARAHERIDGILERT